MATYRAAIRLVAACALAMILGFTGAAAAGAAGAQRVSHRPARHQKHKKTTKKKKVKKKKKKVKKKRAITSCTGIGPVGPEYVWLDHYGTNINQLTRIVCTAADHSTVLIKMFFIVPDAPVARTFLRDVEVMHRYHHVTFRIFVDKSGKHSGVPDWRPAAKLTPGIPWYGCYGSCGSPRKYSVTHTKFIALSRLRTTHRPALFTTSTNITGEQLQRTVQSGILFTRNTPLYQRFVHEFDAYRRCSAHGGCNLTRRVSTWQRYGPDSVYFTPDNIDPITTDLANLDCSHGGTIEIASLWVRAHHVLKVLLRDRAAGCRLRVIVEHPEVNLPTMRDLGARALLQHDKFIIVTTPLVRRVYAGTEDLCNMALHDNDNFMIRTDTPYVVARYRASFAYEWAHSHGLPAAAKASATSLELRSGDDS